MKIYFCVFITLIITCSCTADISDMLETMTEQEQRVDKLEKWRESVNNDIALLKKLYTAIQKQDFVVSVTPLEDGSGHKLLFMEGGSVIIRDGKGGITGDSGNSGGQGLSPSLTVIDDTDGNRYWGQVIDGKVSFILDGAGHKVIFDTQVEAITPIIGINTDGFWTIDFGDGLGAMLMRNNAGDPIRATCTESLIVRSDINDDRVILYLSDGNQITFPVNDALTLTTRAWQCFFDPLGNLSVYGQVIDEATTERFLNKGMEVEYVNRWERVNDTIIWGLHIPASGRVFVTPIMGVLPAQAGSTIEIKLGNQSQTIKTIATGSLTTFAEQPQASFIIPEAGFYQLCLVLKARKVNSGTVGYVKGCDLRGGLAMKGARVEAKRWRPEAHHYGYASTTGVNDFVTMIVEQEVISRAVSVYSPVTTPFGYSGVSWDAGGQQFGVLNFSLWRDNVPDHTKWSHLIAVGPGYAFGAFDHEGAGVKPRGPSPYTGYKIYRTAIAVTKRHGSPYTRYETHYLNPATGKDWLLYGSANDYTGQTNKSYLSVGGFIEITGNAVATRTGHRARVLRYRSWGIRENGTVVPMDRFNHQAGVWYSNKNAYIDSENYFVASAGGWGLGSLTSTPLVLTEGHTLPEFMSPEKLKALTTMPAIIRGEANPVEITSSSAKVTIIANAIGTNPVGEIYWGTTDELTFADDQIKKYAQWQNRKLVPSVTLGSNTYEIAGLLPNTKYYWRFSVKNNEGLTWIDNTYSFTTNP